MGDGRSSDDLAAAARLAHDAFEAALARVAVGTSGWTIAAAAHEHARRHGATHVDVYVGTGREPLGTPGPDPLAAGELVCIAVELAAADGCWAEHLEMVAIGELDAGREALAEASLRALDAARDALRPGAALGAAAAAIERVGADAGLEWGRSHGHGHALDRDPTDGPVVADAATPVDAGATFALHVNLHDPRIGVGVSVGGGHIVTSAGAQPLGSAAPGLRHVHATDEHEPAILAHAAARFAKTAERLRALGLDDYPDVPGTRFDPSWDD